MALTVSGVDKLRLTGERRRTSTGPINPIVPPPQPRPSGSFSFSFSRSFSGGRS